MLHWKSVNLTKQILYVKAFVQTKVKTFFKLWSEIQYFKSTPIRVNVSKIYLDSEGKGSKTQENDINLLGGSFRLIYLSSEQVIILIIEIGV